MNLQSCRSAEAGCGDSRRTRSFSSFQLIVLCVAYEGEWPDQYEHTVCSMALPSWEQDEEVITSYCLNRGIQETKRTAADTWAETGAKQVSP